MVPSSLLRRGPRSGISYWKKFGAEVGGGGGGKKKRRGEGRGGGGGREREAKGGPPHFGSNQSSIAEKPLPSL